MTITATVGTACGQGLPGASSVRALPAGGEWDGFLASVIDERAVPMVANALEQGLLIGTREQRDVLDVAHEASMRACVGLEQATLEVVKTLGSAGVDLRLLKGPAVAHLDYPDPSWRAFGDVDILVRSDHYDVAVRTLTNVGGYRRSAEVRPGFDRRFGKGVCMVLPNGVQVDVHRTLASGPFGLTIDLDELFDGMDTVGFGGERIPVLSREHRLAHACFHASLGDPTPRVVALRDIAQLVLTTDVDVDATRAACVRWRAGVVMAHAVGAAWKTLDLASTPLSEWATAYVGDRFERRSLAAYLGPDRSYARQMIAGVPAVRGWSAKAAYVRSLLFVDAGYARRHGGGVGRRLRRAWHARAIREPVS